MTSLTFRALTENDVCQDYLETMNDKIYMRYSRQSLVNHSLESLKNYINQTSTNPNDILLGAFLDGDYIGNIGIDYDQFNKLANISIVVFKRFAQKGYGKFMFEQAISHIQNIRTVHKIEIGTMADNQGMIALAKSCGFVADGTRKQHLWDGSSYHNCVYYAKFIK